MRKEKFALFLVLLVGATLLIGCAQQNSSGNQTSPNNQTQTPPANQTTVSVRLDQIYRYDSVKSYEYRVTSNSEGQTTITYEDNSISSDTINGTATWVRETDVTVNGTPTASRIWIEKTTFRCLKRSIIIGNQTEQFVSCPLVGSNSALIKTMPQANYTGKESVTVPAGTFECDEYYSGGATYWVNNTIPVPVKIAYGNDSTMELTGYT